MSTATFSHWSVMGAGWSHLLHGEVTWVVWELPICKWGDPRKPLGLSASPPDELRQLGAAWAPTPGSVGKAAGPIDALLTTEATQMANPCIEKAAGGAGDGSSALPWDSLRLSQWSLLL